MWPILEKKSIRTHVKKTGCIQYCNKAHILLLILTPSHTNSLTPSHTDSLTSSHILLLILTPSQVTCRIKRDFSGSGYALNFGLLTCVCTPRCGDARVKVETGDVVSVTRWGRYWVYGDKKLPQGESVGVWW